MILYHFTCEHAAAGILGDGGVIVPRVHPLLGYGVVWLSLEPAPTAAALGLASRQLVTCDRMAARFVVDEPVDAVPWYSVRDRLPGPLARQLTIAFQAALGTRPGVWYLSRVPQRGRLG